MCIDRKLVSTARGEHELKLLRTTVGFKHTNNNNNYDKHTNNNDNNNNGNSSKNDNHNNDKNKYSTMIFTCFFQQLTRPA